MSDNDEERIRSLINTLLREINGPRFPGRQHKMKRELPDLAEELAAHFRRQHGQDA